MKIVWMIHYMFVRLSSMLTMTRTHIVGSDVQVTHGTPVVEFHRQVGWITMSWAIICKPENLMCTMCQQEVKIPGVHIKTGRVRTQTTSSLMCHCGVSTISVMAK
ncbi:hypothetical protein DN30_3597 [Vibrio cholerae]|nr:hypothetical protein DN30_3597 [Vibrio cholerae]